VSFVKLLMALFRDVVASCPGFLVSGCSVPASRDMICSSGAAQTQVLVVSVDGYNVEGLPGKKAIKELQDRKVSRQD